MPLKSALQKLSEGTNLSPDEMAGALGVIMEGAASAAQTGAFLMGLRVKGETAREIAGAVQVLRSRMLKVDAPDTAMDIVGTGGDGAGTYNISTASAIVVAAAGVPVAKHGNKALSSRSGSSEALAALGVHLDLAPEQTSACIRSAGIGFMFAPNHHPAMRHVGPARAELGVRTMFNLLGPLCNPAGVRRYLLGVFAPEWVRPVAEALLENGAQSAWVVHGSDGLDEITTTGSTHVCAIKNGAIEAFQINPDDVGLDLATPQSLQGGSPDHNAAAIRKLFQGEKSAYRDIVLMNAGAALLIADKADDLAGGVALAAEMIDSGAAANTLERLAAVSAGFGK